MAAACIKECACASCALLPRSVPHAGTIELARVRVDVRGVGGSPLRAVYDAADVEWAFAEFVHDRDCTSLLPRDDDDGGDTPLARVFDNFCYVPFSLTATACGRNTFDVTLTVQVDEQLAVASKYYDVRVLQDAAAAALRRLPPRVVEEGAALAHIRER